MEKYDVSFDQKIEFSFCKINTFKYHQRLIKLHRALRGKRLDYQQRYDKLIFLHDKAPSHTSKIVRNYLDTQLGGATPCNLFTRPGPFRLPPVFVNGPCACWAELRFLRRRPKMPWWVVCLEKEGIFCRSIYKLSAR